LEEVFRSKPFAAVIHFAGLKAPGESVYQPLRYYQNNITGTLILCEMMSQYRVKDLVFSSSATVYGDTAIVPVREDFLCHQQANPYGRTKRMIEIILEDLHAADEQWNIALLRYFNPVGAHPSGRIGEDPQGIPNNLMPVISQVAVGRLPELKIFGGDYPTPDGTGIRDYIHVVDLAAGHLKALDKLQEEPGLTIYNLGTNRGYSVLELVRTFESISGRKIPYRIVERRPGDIAVSYADVSKAQHELGWRAQRGIEDMCADTWRWQSSHPNGYGE
jgi:UDP-glucose 4-epimerase